MFSAQSLWQTANQTDFTPTIRQTGSSYNRVHCTPLIEAHVLPGATHGVLHIRRLAEAYLRLRVNIC